MRRRNNRRSNFYNEELETRKIVTISFIVLMIAVLAFIITFILYRNYLNRQTEIAQMKASELTKIGKVEQEESSTVSVGIGKSINEVQESESQNVIENKTKTYSTEEIIDSNSEEKNKVNSDESIEKETPKESTTVSKTKENVTKKEEKIPDPTFKKPVEGEIVKGFAKDTLVYSNTLQEWVTHTGIDIKAEKTAIVKASTDGTIKSIKNDPRYGITVVIEHVNGYISIYSNLLTAEFIKEGEKVKQGQTIGTVGNTATFEIADEPHLHFEILKNEEYVNPEQYIK